MLESEKRSNENRLSIRTSIVVWLGGAVLGWVVAVLAIYSVLRAPDKHLSNNDGNASIQQASHAPTDGGNPADLSAIEPAAGPGVGGSPKSGAKKIKP